VKREGLGVEVDEGVEEGVKVRGVELVMRPLLVVVLITPPVPDSWAVSGVKSLFPLTDRQYWNRTLSSTDDTVRLRLKRGIQQHRPGQVRSVTTTVIVIVIV
jgi:hypothetical protein